MMRFKLTRLLTTAAVGTFAAPSSNHAYIAGSKAYIPLPFDLILKKVVIIARHGDRSQIARNLSSKYPEEDNLREFWEKKLPSTQQLSKLAGVAVIAGTTKNGLSSLESIYEGEDLSRRPFGMLTSDGVSQLVAAGSELRKRYFGSFIPDEDLDTDNWMYCRSTHMCRTILSLRSILVGLYGERLPRTPVEIDVRPKSEETMYPQASGPCPAMGERRNVIIGEDFLLRTVDGYQVFERRMKGILGVTENEKMNWVTTKEILSCHETHGYPIPAGITEDDVEKVGSIAAHMWGSLYKDDTLNRLGIGCFLSELLADLSSIIEYSSLITGQGAAGREDRQRRSPKVSIYSGHDSTLVPLLCALGIYDDVWPPYASYLTLEIADERAVRPLESASDDSGRSLHHRWVRVLYNDAEMVFPGDKTLTRDGQGAWWPYEHLKQRLRQLSMTHEEYRDICILSEPTVENSAARAKAVKDMEEEVAATISGGARN